MKKLLYSVVIGMTAFSAHATSYVYHQPVSCLMKDNVCVSYKPTQGPIINNGAKPWFYPEQGKDYAQIPVGSSKTLTFLVANIGTGPLTVYGFDKGSLADAGMAQALADVKYNPNPFVLTQSDCPVDSAFVLGVNATCTLAVKFLPSTAGSFGDVLKMLHSSAEVNEIIQDIRGTGVATPVNANPGSDGTPTTGGTVSSTIEPNPDVTPEMAKAALGLSVGSLNFGQVPKNTSTPPLSVVLTNKLDEALAFSSKRVSNGWFKFTDNCGTTLPANGSCTFQFTMDTSAVIKPQSLDTFTVQFKEGASATVGLSGTVLGTAIAATPNPAEVTSYALDQETDTSLILTNSGTAPASVTNFSITDAPLGIEKDLGGFIDVEYSTSASTTTETLVDELGSFTPSSSGPVKLKSQDCAVIPANGTCSVVVSVKSATEVDAVKYLNYELEGKIYSVKLKAKVADADLSLSPNTLDWGVVPFYSTTEKTLTITNVGGKTVSGIKANLPPLFTLKSSTCEDSLSANASCVMSISYSPSETTVANTSRSASILNNGDIKSIPFNVKGGGEGAIVVASKDRVSFGKVNPVTGYPSSSISLKNTGTTTATLSSIQVDSDNFLLKSNTCSSSLAAGASCDITVQLNTSSNGVASGNVKINSSSLKKPELSIPVSAEVNGAILTAKPDKLLFGEVAYGTSHTKTATITNDGNMPVKLLTVRAISDRIEAQSTCTDNLVLQPKGTCTVSFTFDAGLSARTQANATVEITSDAAKNAVSISASGIAKGSYLEAPTSATAPLTRVGNFSVATATLTNQGVQPFNITNLALNTSKPDASNWSNATHNCTNIGFQQSCAIQVKFTPGSYGTKYGEVQFISNDARMPTGSISLVGEGMDGDIAFYVDGTLTRNFNFGRLQYNALASKSINMVNLGVQTTRVLSGSSTNSDWNLSGCVGQTLAPQGVCQFSINSTIPYKSGAETSSTADFNFTFDKAIATSFRANYSAAGAWPSVSGNVVFENKTPYNISKAKTVTITNTGNRPLELTSWQVLNDSAKQISLDTTNCVSSIPSNGTCTLTVNYTAKNEGTFATTITAQSNTNSTAYSTTPGELKFTVSGESASAYPRLSVNMEGSTNPVTRTIYLYNAGSAGLTLQSASLNMTQGSGSLPTGVSNCTALAAKSYCAIPVTFQGTALAGTFNIRITGAAGSDGNGTFSIPLANDPAVYPISSNEDFDFPGAHPTASLWYSAISHDNASSDGNFSTYNVATELALGTGPVLRFRTGYGQSINKVVAYVKNVKPYTLELGVYDSSDTNSGHQMVPLSKVAVPAYYQGFVTINFPQFNALSSAPSAWPYLDKSWALQATEVGMTTGRYMIIYEYRVGKTP